MILTLVGSMAFYDRFAGVKRALEANGHEVITPTKDDVPEPVPKERKLAAMREFNSNLERSDAILVLNYPKQGKDNHIGVNTLMEIGMAFNRGKKVLVLNPVPASCAHELEAIGCIQLDGDLNRM